MEYPRGFPDDSRARVEAAGIRAGRRFDSEKAKAESRSEIEALFWTYVLTPFLVFAEESSRLGLWSSDETDRKCREFLRRLTIDAYYRKGKAGGLPDMIDNWDGSIIWKAQQEIEKTSQWRKYENLRLKQAVVRAPLTRRTGIVPGQNDEAVQIVECKSTTTTTVIGNNIDRFRKECGWSFEQLAKETGIDKKSIISHVNKGAKPTPRIRKEYAQAFGKTLGRTITALDLEK